ncbi:MAG: zinc transporter ZntB [Rhodobacteraceae bacterium]|nr:zinc transporter ZntB [Paracoccaceae bacterium]
MTAVTTWQSGPIGEGAGFYWRHYDLAEEAARGALEAEGLEPLVYGALTAPETRPRCAAHGDGLLINLRGVNLNPGAEPEDMVSLRLWVTGAGVISAQMRRLRALGDVREGLERGAVPDGPAELVARIALRLADRAEPVVADLNEAIDGLEEEMEDGRGRVTRAELSQLRRRAVQLRRYFFPQRDALSTFEIEDASWIRPHDRLRLREATERVTRLGEELDAIRDRAQLVQEQIMDARAERMNRQMLVLSVAAALFLPLGLITGLLGVNVAGIPGTETPWAFWAVCAILGLVAAGQLWAFWWIGLIGRRRD